MLPPTPMVLRPPQADDLAVDGTLALPMGTDATGWLVFNADGQLEELLALIRGEKLTAEDLCILDAFERERFELGDPHFCDYDPRARQRQALTAPPGRHRVLSLSYHHDAPSPDGTRSVLVSAQGELDSWLVLDGDGRLLEGAHFPDATHAHGARSERFAALLKRRANAGDPRVTVTTAEWRVGAAREAGSEGEC